MFSENCNYRRVTAFLGGIAAVPVVFFLLFTPAVFAEYTQCNDGIDNDRDGNIDYPADPGCFTPDDKDETNITSAFMFDQTLSFTPSFIFTMTDGRTSARPGDILTYQLIIRNSSILAIAGMRVRATLPRELVFNSATDGGRENRQLVEWENLTFLPGETKVIYLYATVPVTLRSGTAITTTASIDNGPSATDLTFVQSRTQNGISLIAQSLSESIEAGRFLTYLITVRNSRPESRTVQLRATLDSGATYSVASDQGRLRGRSDVSWGNVFVRGNAETTVRLTVLVSADLRAGQSLRFTARAADAVSTAVTPVTNSTALAPYGQYFFR